MEASSKALVPCGVDNETSRSQVVEIEPKDQPGSSRVQAVDHGDTQDESDDELEHETVQQENVQILQQQQLEDSWFPVGQDEHTSRFKVGVRPAFEALWASEFG